MSRLENCELRSDSAATAGFIRRLPRILTEQRFWAHPHTLNLEGPRAIMSQIFGAVRAELVHAGRALLPFWRRLACLTDSPPGLEA